MKKRNADDANHGEKKDIFFPPKLILNSSHYSTKYI